MISNKKGQGGNFRGGAKGKGQGGRKGPSPDDVCDSCGEMGHWAYQCPQNANKGKGKGKPKQDKGGQNAPPDSANPTQ